MEGKYLYLVEADFGTRSKSVRLAETETVAELYEAIFKNKYPEANTSIRKFKEIERTEE